MYLSSSCESPWILSAFRKGFTQIGLPFSCAVHFITKSNEKYSVENNGGSDRQLEVLIHLSGRATINPDLLSTCQSSAASLSADVFAESQSY